MAQATPVARRSTAAATIQIEDQPFTTVTDATNEIVSVVPPSKEVVATIKPPPFRIISPSRRPERIVSTRRDIKVLVYGPYGIGKTYFAGSAEDVVELRDVCFITAEAGEMSIDNRPFIDRIPVRDFSQFARIKDMLNTHFSLRDRGDLKGLAELEIKFRGLDYDLSRLQAVLAKHEAALAIAEAGSNRANQIQRAIEHTNEEIADVEYDIDLIRQKPHQYRTVVIDSLTEVNKYCMYQLLGIDIDKQRLDEELPVAEGGDWGNALEMTRMLVRAFRSMPATVIFVCSEDRKENEKKQIIKRPNLPGKLAGEVQGFVDVVGWLWSGSTTDEDKAVERRLYITQGQTFDAKNRFTGIDARYVANPSMATLLDLHQESLQNIADAVLSGQRGI